MIVTTKAERYPIESSFVQPPVTMVDYFMLKEKFEDLENQIEELPRLIPAAENSNTQVDIQGLELRLNSLEESLESVRSLVKEYCKKFPIETNFTFRFQECLKRAYAILPKVQQSVQKRKMIEW
jgi:hypothetical protein